MDARRGHGTRGSSPGTSRLVLLTAIAALVAGACAGPLPSPAPSVSRPAPSASATATNGVSTLPPRSSQPSEGEWGELVLPPLAQVASLEPTRRGANLVAADTAFTLRSLDGTPVTQVAKRITVEPAVRLVAGPPSGDAIALRPSGGLTAGQAYRFTLSRADGSVVRTWTVQVADELSLVGTIPGDGSTDVPIDTAIEMTFDQTGVSASAFEEHFAISPSTTGRFETHGRAVAFIPDEPLKPFTVYTVTLAKGLPLAGTGQSLRATETIQFETRRETAYPDVLQFERAIIDVAVADKPIVEASFDDRNNDGQLRVPAILPVSVHRLDTMERAMDAWRRLAGMGREWASTGPTVATSDLEPVLTTDVPVQQIGDSTSWLSREAILRLPEPLPRGWYVLTTTFEGQPWQMLIQVANIAAFAQVTETKTAVWVNSVGTGEPIPDATVSVAGTAIGSTNQDGLLVAETPRTARSAGEGRTPFMVVQAEGRTLLVALDYEQACWGCEGAWEGGPGWWHVLALDRQRFRPTDRLDVWGVVKARADGTVPDEVELSLEASDYWSGTAPPIVVERTRPLDTGMFSVQLPFRDAPVGDYRVVLRVDGDEVDGQYVRIEPIAKPAFQLDVTTSRRAVVSGASVDVDVAATFFEGTPAAGVNLRVGAAEYWEQDARSEGTEARTSIDGRAAVALPLAMTPSESEWASQWSWFTVRVRPTLPEEAEIGGETRVAVFRSTALLDVDASVDGDQLLVTGSVHDVDFATMERSTAGDWSVDPRGGPRAGAKVRLRVVEARRIRTKTGTSYDPITKTVRPVYTYHSQERELGIHTVLSSSDGTFQFALPATAVVTIG